MLFSLLVKFWLSPIMAVGSWPCSNEQAVHSIYSYHLVTPSSGILLTFRYNQPYILHHPCGNHFPHGISPALYLGERLFISFDMFESSILPLTIPNGFTRSPAIVSAAVFGQNTIVAVVNGVVFVYLYATWKRWLHSEGITRPVTELATYKCCFALNDPSCDKINELIMAYDPGNLVSTSEIFYSRNGGYIFQSLKSRPVRDAILLGIYVFYSSSCFGILLQDTSHPNVTYFRSGDIEFTSNTTGKYFGSSIPSGYTVKSMSPPGMRGFLFFWTNKTFTSTSNDAWTTEDLFLIPTDTYRNKSFPKGICFVAATSNEFAVLTQTQLFYGNINALTRQMVHLGDNNVSSAHASCEAMLFENIGILSIIHPFPSNTSKYYHFRKCIINIQDKLMAVQPPLQSCPMEILRGDFHNRMYYIDANQILHFNATFVPKPGTDAYPYVTLSNPQVLGFEAHIVDDGYTSNGNSKYKLKIKLAEQHLNQMVKKENSTLFKKVSSLTVDIYNKGIFCIDMHPLTALIVLGCPPKKHIRILKRTTGCSLGLFEPTLLQNAVHSIDKKLYDPLFLGRKKLEQDDLNVSYKYDFWGCPLLLFYDKPWLPAFELWDNDEFVEYVSADFVLYEINGMHNYDYLLNEIEANCLSEAQNWTKQLAKFPGSPQSAWNRYNYVNCKKYRGNTSLPSVNSKYQVLNRDEKNRIIFSQYNGFYIFRATVVDSLYSYCDLTTVFSVYVHGALPKTKVSVGKALISFLVLIFGTMLIVYFFLKLLKEYSRTK
ncbi:cation channel sperm-associated auxiliary subunit delta-like [Erythrolamprus reginae]|uniref:cation channel sperm-associated auxiliary subunit delta-like n=1 Tax=Erythrolamprus reginae TaxID=121349 RepID=UPI00396C7BB6